jgi:hypothetical protein
MRRPRASIVVGVALLVAAAVGGTSYGIATSAAPPARRAATSGGRSHGARKGLATTATTSPGNPARAFDGPNGVEAGWVVRENQLPGTSTWLIQGNQPPGAIAGYANLVSAQRGEPVTLQVSSGATTFHVEAYRIGWYQGHGARLVWTSPEAPAGRQAPCMRGLVNMVECHWGPSMTITVGADWPPGDYIFKLVGDGGQQSWVPLTVRDDASTSAYLVQNDVTTWQAYNLYGGYDLYSGVSAGGASFANRSRVVSFDRPYSFGSGAADFYGNEYPLIRQVERLGLDVSYTTSVDVDLRPSLLARHRVFISLGHDEYWSTVMRGAVTSAQESGTNLMFLGANAIFRHVRFEPSPSGVDRRMIDYKSAAEDPITATDPAEATSDWPNPPVPRQESSIIGNTYRCNPVSAPMDVVDSGSWITAGVGPLGTPGAPGASSATTRPVTTQLATTQLATSVLARLPGVVGSEYDRYVPGAPAPSAVEIVAHSPVDCRGRPDFSDATYWALPGQGGVFASGTNLWVGALGGACATNCEVPAVTTMTANLLRTFGMGPAGTLAPPRVNWQQFYRPGSAFAITPGP